MTENDYSDLFDLYLDDIDDGSVFPEEFIFSSKIVFISNSATVPSKVKEHTLTFSIDTNKELAKEAVDKKLSDISNDMFETSPPQEVQLEAFASSKGTNKTDVENYLKMLIIHSAGMPEEKSRMWVLAQD